MFKIKLKTTNNIIDVLEHCRINIVRHDSYGNSWTTSLNINLNDIDTIYDNKNEKILFNKNSISKDNIDWEQRRYEIAKEVLPFIMKDKYYNKFTDRYVNYTKEEVAKIAITYSDALIEELKKTNDEKV